MSEGWIKIHRQIQENDLWLKEPFTAGQAWIDLILLAQYHPTSFWIRGIEIKLQRGQLAWSELSLAARWRWSRNKVRRYLRILKSKQQIEQQKSSLTSIITILKYNDYQQSEQQNGQQAIQQKDNRRYTYKESKERKEAEKKLSTASVDKPKPAQGAHAPRQEANTIVSPEKFIEEYHRRRAQGWRAEYGRDLVVIGANNEIRLKIHNGQFVGYSDDLRKIIWKRSK